MLCQDLRNTVNLFFRTKTEKCIGHRTRCIHPFFYFLLGNLKNYNLLVWQIDCQEKKCLKIVHTPCLRTRNIFLEDDELSGECSCQIYVSNQHLIRYLAFYCLTNTIKVQQFLMANSILPASYSHKKTMHYPGVST